MAGKDIKNGCLLIGDDGKILVIGEKIDAPSDSEIIDVEGRLVTPVALRHIATSGSVIFRVRIITNPQAL